ncbi:hypothetical protein N7468_009451 [Penicillium chermesinum]|uniref:Uncharacterized protein n=1 Tax=Penicillium chermesinum TaxID=63820 RepID=A0A9W9TEV0_9EURO|nr:uncharacterized protein N7468_009451 [Penicillium chermesinum]KAJ5220247.1 hypothetical protein N7468_009451 [Penicillium chermesinum]KAJ6157691.1 hypothetical protein N7470_005283 [Penicillium chermesinum]
MRISTILLSLTACVWAQTPDPATTSAPGFNIASLSSALQDLTANATRTGNFGNISPPPKNMLQEIMAVIPGAVYWDLFDPHSRSSLASQISAGNTPTWYAALPTDVKNYMTVVKAQIAGGALTATTGLAYETTSASTDTAKATSKEATDKATSTPSKGVAPAQATGLTGSVAGVLGVLGLVLVL